MDFRDNLKYFRALHTRISLRSIDTVSDWAGRVFCWLLIPTMLFLVLEVILRYAFARPTIWAYDVIGQLNCAVGLVAGAYTLVHEGHVRVDVLYNRFRPTMKLIANIAGWVFFFLYIGPVLWNSSIMAWTSLIAKEVKYGVFRPPIYPLKILMAAAVLLLFLQGIAQFVRYLKGASVRKKAQ